MVNSHTNFKSNNFVLFLLYIDHNKFGNLRFICMWPLETEKYQIEIIKVMGKK